MDREQRTSDIIRQYYDYKKTDNPVEFIKATCNMFDDVKDSEITDSTLDFLQFMANEAGLPQYYDLLVDKFIRNERTEREKLPLCTLGSIFYDASLLENNQKLHKYQQEVISRFQPNAINRFVLTAPTSFGKTFTVYQIIKKMHYKNVLLIFPAISLLSENLEKINGMKGMEEYSIHTLSEEEYDLSKNNIFIYTPERFLSFIDRYKEIQFDFTFIDEIYKIDNGFLTEEDEVEENERDVAYRLALEFGCSRTKDMFLAGPYLALNNDNSFSAFVKENGFNVLRYNDYEIVGKKYYTINGQGSYSIDDAEINVYESTKTGIVADILYGLGINESNTIVYFGRKSDTESYAKRLLDNQDYLNKISRNLRHDNSVYSIFLNHLVSNFGEDWIVVRALQHGIGIHHGLIPKYIQKEIINLFNSGDLMALFSTTTITEGVNTTAKNMVVMSDKKGGKPLKQFDAKNIAGRAGRFRQHYSGNVIVVENDFKEVIDNPPEELRHKNYDVDSLKQDVDYQITKDKYLSIDQKMERDKMLEKVTEYGIPFDIFNLFKVVGAKDKLFIFETLQGLQHTEWEKLGNFIRTLRYSGARTVDWDGFQCFLNVIQPIVKDKELKGIIDHTFIKKDGSEYSVAVVLLWAYLQNGFMGMLEYYVDKGEKKDVAMKNVAKIIYNTFKYQLVKYLGVFDVFYRFILSKRLNINFEKVEGVSILLRKLEYNAMSDQARKASDYGVPFKVVRFYDEPNSNITFDKYEAYINNKVQSVLK